MNYQKILEFYALSNRIFSFRIDPFHFDHSYTAENKDNQVDDTTGNRYSTPEFVQRMVI